MLEYAMSPAAIFSTHLLLGYAAWGLVFFTYGWPRLRSMNVSSANRAIAALHSFRFFGLIFILPGIVGPQVPSGFAIPAAWGDLATSLLAMLALVSFTIRPLFWLSVVAFNLVGSIDLVCDYFYAARLHLPEASGQLGLAYLIPILYVPVLVMTHLAAFALMIRASSDALASAKAGSTHAA